MGHDKGLKGGRWEIWLDFKGFLRRWILSWCVDEPAIVGQSKIEQTFGF